jgi:hypothetical protein
MIAIKMITSKNKRIVTELVTIPTMPFVFELPFTDLIPSIKPIIEAGSDKIATGVKRKRILAIPSVIDHLACFLCCSVINPRSGCGFSFLLMILYNSF